MNRSSIFYSITFIFFLAALSIFLAFLWLMEYDKQNYTKELNTKYTIVARANLFYINNLISKDEFDIQVKGYEFATIGDKNTAETIINTAKVLQKIESELGSSAILFYKKRNYLLIQHDDKIIVLKDKDYQPYRYDIIKVIFFCIFIVLLGTYIFTIKKIKPLRKLKRQIDKFAKGELTNILDVSTGNDEISQVSKAFYSAVQQIKSLNTSRQLFLRNITHELKTPITKGRITSEMIPETKYQQRLINVFERLESLINELAAIEKITSGIRLNDIKKYRIIDLLDEAVDLTMADKENINIKLIDDVYLNVDFKLFSIAIKNMVDNGIKYSTDHKIKIVVDLFSIKFISKGESLDKDLPYYLEPFSQEKISKGFGLGLYIVDNILKAHHLKIGYKHKNGYNVFSFNNLKEVVNYCIE